MNNRDLFHLLQIVLDKSIPRNEAKQKAIEYSEEHKTDKAVIMTLAGATNMKLDYNAFRKGDGNMCTLFEEIANESREEGRADGKATGIIKMLKKYNESDSNILKELMDELGISIDRAKEYLMRYQKGIL